MRRLLVIVVAGIAVVVLAVAQLTLPSIAEHRLRERLGRSGEVLSVEVHAFPAIELLWHHADRVVVRLGRYRSGPGSLGSLLGDTSGVGSLDASARELDAGLLTLREATLEKRGVRLTGTARITEADLRASVPILSSVRPVASASDQLTLRGTATLLGVTASVDAAVRAQDGTLVVVPEVPFGALATITVFDDPSVAVQSVGATAAPGGFRVTATGTVK
jgi:LmeA-like phospholipid-binding